MKVLDWLFTPIHNTIRMTPLTCVTTLACGILAAIFVLQMNFIALCASVGICVFNTVAHEVYHWRGPQ